MSDLIATRAHRLINLEVKRYHPNMNNEKISKHLSQLADLLEFTGANSFRLRAYRNGSRIIKELPESIASMIEANQDLTKLDGIGKGVAEKCHELVSSGRL